MKRPTPSPENLEDLIALCLELYEVRGASAVDDVLVGHPDSAELVRERLDLLGRMGLVGQAPEDSTPERIGDYRILGVLGRGGMGVVFEAEQERPRRRVALKVLRSLPDGKGRSRFEHESELLARLQHPGIAQVYEAGTATVGGMTVPFFAMELVRGRPLDVFAREEALDVRARLVLIAKVADAVHHAHQKGVVHRDLKPGNVLVDERGEPRVLDFGIARAVDPDLRLETLRTEVGQLVGTLAYMSPEQAAGDPDEIDSRSDVYSLGVIAYELLAGRLPLEVGGRSVLEVLAALREEDPPPLGALDRGLRGDVETLVAKALAKEKGRRYPSAHELAADVRRFLEHEPITARPATATYQLARFARRHRALVAGVVAVFVVLVLGLAGTLSGLARAERERADAESRFRQADAVLRFQTQMFATADPNGDGIRVWDLLDRAALTIEEVGRDELEEASVRLMLGDAYTGIGAWDEAEGLITAAVETFDRELGPDDLQSLTARTRLGHLLAKKLGRYEQAEETLAGVVERASRAHGADHDVVLRARLVLAELWNEAGRYVEAADMAREVERLVEPGQPLRADAQHELSYSLGLIDRVAAVEVARESLAWRRATYGADDPRTWGTMERLGYLLLEGGELEESSELYQRVFELRREHLGPEHGDTLVTMGNVGGNLAQSGRYEESAELLRELVEICQRELAPDHPTFLTALNNLANAYLYLGDHARAEPIFRRVLETSVHKLGPEHPNTVTTMGNLAQALQGLGQRPEAERLFTEALAILRRKVGDREVDTLQTAFNLAIFYQSGGRLDQAEPLFVEALTVGRETLEPDSMLIGAFLFGLGRNQLAQGRFEDAEATLFEALEQKERTLPADHPTIGRVLSNLAELYQAWGKPEDAAMFLDLARAR